MFCCVSRQLSITLSIAWQDHPSSEPLEGRRLPQNEEGPPAELIQEAMLGLAIPHLHESLLPATPPDPLLGPLLSYYSQNVVLIFPAAAQHRFPLWAYLLSAHQSASDGPWDKSLLSLKSRLVGFAPRSLYCIILCRDQSGYGISPLTGILSCSNGQQNVMWWDYTFIGMCPWAS